jgi:hypothetical protein
MDKAKEVKSFKLTVLEIGSLMIMGFVAAGVYWGASYLMPTKYKFAMQNFVRPDKVSVADKPHDCNWDVAPLGNKYCHYEEVPIINHDQSGNIESIYVSWSKIRE